MATTAARSGAANPGHAATISARSSVAWLSVGLGKG